VATPTHVMRRSRFGLILGIIISALLVVTIAYADNVVNDVDATVGATFTAGGSTDADYWIVANSGDGQTGCNAADGSKATVTINVPSGVTATPSSLEFIACGTGAAQSVTFSSNTADDYAITASVSDSGTGTYNLNPASFTLHVLAGGDNQAPQNASISIDNGATYTNSATPSVALDISGTDNVGITKYRLATSQAGLATASDVSVTATTSLSIDDLAFNPSWSSEGSNSAWVRLYDAAGNSADANDSIFWDKTKPVNAVTGVSNAAIYTLGSVPAAGCTTTDPGADATPQTGSGVATSASVNVTGGTVNGVGSFTATCSGGTDNAGNSADNASVTYQVYYGGVSGILQPINPDNTSVFSRGKAVPVKFQLAGDEYTGFNYTGWTLKQQQTSCMIDGDPVGGELEPVVENPSNGFRYDSAADQYIYNANFKAKEVGTCWKVKVTLDSGQVLESAIFKLQK
jgi:hypothetical protein